MILRKRTIDSRWSIHQWEGIGMVVYAPNETMCILSYALVGGRFGTFKTPPPPWTEKDTLKVIRESDTFMDGGLVKIN